MHNQGWTKIYRLVGFGSSQVDQIFFGFWSNRVDSIFFVLDLNEKVPTLSTSKKSRHLTKICKIQKKDQLDLIQIQYKKYWINSTWSKTKKKKLDQHNLIEIQRTKYRVNTSSQNPKRLNWINLTWYKSKGLNIGSTSVDLDLKKILYQIFTIQKSIGICILPTPAYYYRSD